MNFATNFIAISQRYATQPTVWVLALSPFLNGAELKPQTLKAWDEYIEAATPRALARLGSDSSSLWADEESSRSQQIRRGQILASPVTEHGRIIIPSGLIHHWIGAVFIPNRTILDVLAVLRGYDQYKKVYRPSTVDAKLISREENRDRFSAILSRKVLFVSTTVAGKFQSEYTPLSMDRWLSASHSTRLQDVLNYGQPTERRVDPNNGSGFLWRIYSFSRFLQRDGGVYFELEGIVLTRDVPSIWRWLVNPIMDNLSRETILTSLQETRDAVGSPAKDVNLSGVRTSQHSPCPAPSVWHQGTVFREQKN